MPLPEHAPPSLFADLNLPEVTILIPNRQPDGPPQIETMPVLRAISEYTPGNASRRFAVKKEWHWIPLPEPDEAGRRSSDITEWIGTNCEQVGELIAEDDRVPRPLLRPWQIELQRPPRDRQAAKARPRWTSAVTPAAEGWPVDLPARPSEPGLIAGLSFNTHALGSEVKVARGIATVTAEDEEGIQQVVELARGETPVALGFTAESDAMRLRLRVSAIPRFSDLSEAAQRAIRTSWFEKGIAGDEALLAELSPFTCGWLGTLYLAAVASIAMAKDANSLALAVERVEQEGLDRCMLRALEAVFVVDEGDESRGVERLKDAIASPQILARGGRARRGTREVAGG